MTSDLLIHSNFASPENDLLYPHLHTYPSFKSLEVNNILLLDTLVFYSTASLKPLPALNFGTFFAGICNSLPV